MNKMIGIFLLLFLFLFTSLSCSPKHSDPQIEPEPDEGVEIPLTDDKQDEKRDEIMLREGESIPFTSIRFLSSVLPDELEDWIENSKNTFMGQSKEFEGKTYILATFGQKPTGGYTVQITDVVYEESALTARVELKEPAPNDTVTQALTYPYDIVSVELTGVPVVFSAYGDVDYIFELTGIEELRPIVAESQLIKVFAPAPGSYQGDKLFVEGVANVFEGTVNYRLLSEGEEVLEGFTTAAMGSWQYFSFEIDLVPLGVTSGELLLELFTYSAKDGSEDFKVAILFSIN